MFDVGFSELIVIAVVALVVIGPERLPKVARTAGHLLGRLQRYVTDVKADISREVQLDELKKLQSEMQDSARSFERSIHSELQAVEQVVDQTAQSVEQLVDPTSQSVEAAVNSVYSSDVAGVVAAAEVPPPLAESAVVTGEAVVAVAASADRLAASRLRRRVRHIRRQEMSDE